MTDDAGERSSDLVEGLGRQQLIHATEAETLPARYVADRSQATLWSAISAWFAAASADPDRYGPGLLATLGLVGNSTQEPRLLYTHCYRLAAAA